MDALTETKAHGIKKPIPTFKILITDKTVGGNMGGSLIFFHLNFGFFFSVIS